MTRAFSTDPVAVEIVEELIDLARRAPSAGNASALEWLVLDTAPDVSAYWDTTLPSDRRAAFAWPSLLSAPVIVIPWVDPQVYLDRYNEPDKAHTSLGESLDAWPVPYWFVDGGAAVQTLLLAAQDAGLGALFLGSSTMSLWCENGLECPRRFEQWERLLLVTVAPTDSREASGAAVAHLERSSTAANGESRLRWASIGVE